MECQAVNRPAAGRCTAKVLPLLIYVDSFLDPWCTRYTTFSSPPLPPCIPSRTLARTEASVNSA